jgi:large subunit ribosomal protein L24
MHKIRKGDQVVVTNGKDKGKKGLVLRVLDTNKVLVEGVNRVKKHQRPNPVKGQTGGIIDKEMPVHQSNVLLVNPATGKGDRVGFKFLTAQGREAGSEKVAPRKVRFFKSNGEVVDV